MLRSRAAKNKRRTESFVLTFYRVINNHTMNYVMNWFDKILSVRTRVYIILKVL